VDESAYTSFYCGLLEKWWVLYDTLNVEEVQEVTVDA